MADDAKRVEARLSLAGTGSAATPEAIAKLHEEARRLHNTRRKEPTHPFAQILAAVETATPVVILEEGPNEVAKRRAKAQRYAKLPAKGPLLSLVHPEQGDLAGRDDPEFKTLVILKG